MNRFIKRALFLLAFLVWSTTVFAQGGNPTFIIEKQVGQATGHTCQSYVLAIALAFKRDPQVPLHTWRQLRDVETRIRAEIVKARDARLPKDTPAKDRLAIPVDSAKAVQLATNDKYTLAYKALDAVEFGKFTGARTGVTAKVDLQPSFIIGGLVKDVVISSAKKIGGEPYTSGHQFSILGISGPDNSTREYLVLNSAAYKAKPGEQLFNSCQDELPDQAGPYFPSLSWRNDIEWNFDGNKLRAMTVEKK